MTWSCSVLGTYERTETILGPFMFCSLLRLGLCFILEGLCSFCSGKVFIWIGQLSQVCWRKILCLESQSPSYGLSSVDCLSFCPPHRNQSIIGNCKPSHTLAQLVQRWVPPIVRHASLCFYLISALEDFLNLCVIDTRAQSQFCYLSDDDVCQLNPNEESCHLVPPCLSS